MSSRYIKIVKNKDHVFSYHRIREYDKETFDKLITNKGRWKNDKFIMYEDDHNIYLKIKEKNYE